MSAFGGSGHETALRLFATGLGALGLLSRRKKRSTNCHRTFDVATFTSLTPGEWAANKAGAIDVVRARYKFTP